MSPRFLLLSGHAYSPAYHIEQDRKDDVKAGVKSTALLFGDYVKPILGIFGATFVGCRGLGYRLVNGVVHRLVTAVFIIGLVSIGVVIVAITTAATPIHRDTHSCGLLRLSPC